MDSSKANLVFEKNDKKLGMGRPPPPWLGQNPTFFQRSFLKAPFNKGLMWKAKVESLKEEGTGERSKDKRANIRSMVTCIMQHPNT